MTALPKREQPIVGQEEDKFRNPKRIDPIIKEIVRYWTIHPELRFWQMMSVMHNFILKQPRDIFYVEDSTTLEMLKRINNNNDE